MVFGIKRWRNIGGKIMVIVAGLLLMSWAAFMLLLASFAVLLPF